MHDKLIQVAFTCLFYFLRIDSANAHLVANIVVIGEPMPPQERRRRHLVQRFADLQREGHQSVCAELQSPSTGPVSAASARLLDGAEIDGGEVAQHREEKDVREAREGGDALIISLRCCARG